MGNPRRVCSGEKQIRQIKIRKGFVMFQSTIANFRKFKPLLYELISRDIKNKYRRSVLGVLWTILNPLLMMTILSIVFSNIFRFEVQYYPVYILCGQVLYNFFSDSTQAAMNSIIYSAPLLKKVYVPKYMFTLSRIMSCSINIFAAFAALLIVMVVMRVPLHFTMFLSIIPILIMIVFALGTGFILAAVSVKYRDIVHLYSVFLTGCIYLAPVIYPLSIISNPTLQFIIKLNPVTNMLAMFRGFVIYNTMPDLFTVLMSVIPSIVILAIGLLVFYKKQDEFILFL